jgi:hypothetical protein
MLTAVNHSLSLIALHYFPHLLSTNHKCAHLCLPLFRGEHRRRGRVLERLRGVLGHADPPVIMPVEVKDGAARRLVIVVFGTLDLRVHLSGCNNGYCTGLTLERFVTAMVLHSFCRCVCNLILAHT